VTTEKGASDDRSDDEDGCVHFSFALRFHSLSTYLIPNSVSDPKED